MTTQTTTADLAAAGGTSTSSRPMARCLINGEWTVGEGQVKDVVGPAAEAVVTQVAYASEQQVNDAVAAARAAQREWAAIPLAGRADLLKAALDAISNQAEVARWMTIEMGKTINEARLEVGTVLALCHAALEDARRFTGEQIQAASSLTPNRRVQTIAQPVGVAGLISPWNFPVEMLTNCVASMVMGNTCVWKPSEWAPFGPQLLVEEFAAKLPNGVFNLVYGGPEEGEQLVTSPEVGVVSFIGSTATGERIAKVAGVKRLLLELGGNGPFIVLDDANVDAAVEAAMNACFFEAGQVCTAGERILVHEAVHDEFVEKLTERAGALKVGDPLDESTQMGPLSEKRILAKVVEHVEEAREKGAEITTGGSHKGMFFEPTVLTGVTSDMRIAYEETFGPVAPIIKISSSEEALRIANDSEYGLSMAVFTSSLKTAYEMAEGLESGMVLVNSSTSGWELNGPFGGVKKSGVGRQMGPEGLRAFTNVKMITFDLI